MSRFSLTHLSDDALARELPRLAANERTSTAALLAALAEVDARGAFARIGYASLHAYCVGELTLSPDVAAKRIQAARAVREFPALLEAVEDGRLNASALVLIAPHLTEANLAGLVATIAGRTRDDIRAILAQRFPRVAPMDSALAPHSTAETTRATDVRELAAQQDPDPVPTEAADSQQPTVPLSALAGPESGAPPAPVRFPLHLSVTQDFRDKLAYACDLLGHAVPGGETAEVIERALDAVIEQLEKRRFGKGSRLRPARRGSGANERHVPLAIRREVLRRDGGSCSFVGSTGHRCGSRRRLELDHIVPLARGGQTTAANLRLRCRTHNQLEAERTFGAGFMEGKRERAASHAARTAAPTPAGALTEAAGNSGNGRTEPASSSDRGRTEETGSSIPAPPPPQPGWRDDVFAALRELGYRAAEARGALAACDLGPEASLEARVRVALRSLAVPARRSVPAA